MLVLYFHRFHGDLVMRTSRIVPFLIAVLALTVLSFYLPDAESEEPRRGKDPSARNNSWITFLSHRSGGNLLYRMRPDGSELKPIFGGELKDVPAMPKGLILYREPHWTRQSPDRQFFLSWAADVGMPLEKYQSPAHFHVTIGAMSGGPTRVLVTDADEVFAWSPDSKQFAYATRPAGGRDIHNTRIVVVGADGSNEMTVLDRPGVWSVCDWSPDGKKLLLSLTSSLSLRCGTTDLMEYDLATALREKDRLPPGMSWTSGYAVDRHLRPVTGGQPVRVFVGARYSPDGKSIAVTLSRHLERPDVDFDPKGFELAVLDADGKKMRTIAKYPEGLRGPICWSPEGREILFSRYLREKDKREKWNEAGSGGLALWAIGAEGGEARFLTTGWCPDWR